MRTIKKRKIAQLRRWRIRKKLTGTPERPRMSVRFSGRNIHVQFVDDVAGHTLAAVSTMGACFGGDESVGANVKGAVRVGKAAADAAKGKGIIRVVFDRSGSRYHGKVKALADAAREAGLQF